MENLVNKLFTFTKAKPILLIDGSVCQRREESSQTGPQLKHARNLL